MEHLEFGMVTQIEIAQIEAGRRENAEDEVERHHERSRFLSPVLYLRLQDTPHNK